MTGSSNSLIIARRVRSPPDNTFTSFSLASLPNMKAPRMSRNTGPDVAHGDVVDGLEDGDRLVEPRRFVLREVTDPDVMADPDLALEVDLPHDGLDHRRLALAVAPHESHLGRRARW